MYTLNPAYCRFASQDIGRLVAQQYDLDGVVAARYFTSGLHDNYLIEAGDQKYIFRVYRSNWRQADEVLFELALLDYLRHQHARVASPVLTKSKNLALRIPGHTDSRQGALFVYADGIAPGSDITPAQCTLLGKTVADVHLAAAGFTTDHLRNPLELPYLLDASVTAIGPFLATPDREYLARLHTQLHAAHPVIARDSATYGVCIGDVNASNFHLTPQNEITLFDFDQCGYGYRAFEIAKFIASLQHRPDKVKLAEAFVHGYQQVRSLRSEELAAISYYELIAVIWVMAIHAMNAEYIGYKNLDQSFWARRLAVVKRLAEAREMNA